MTKAQIIAEIQRTATANGGVPLGVKRFEAETGVRFYDWYGVHWSRWSDALREAGFEANKFRQDGFAKDTLLEKFASLASEIGRLPTKGDIRLKRKTDKTLPTDSTFDRLGTKAQVVGLLAEYCQSRPELADVLQLCEQYESTSAIQPDDETDDSEEQYGYVYLFKSGKYFKIGRSNSVGRREYEVGVQMPEEVKAIHSIRTDDPTGIEEYWHRRFADKRKGGEWFDLNAADVRIFKRRKFM